MDDPAAQSSPPKPPKATGPLTLVLEALPEITIPERPRDRNFFLRMGELLIFLVAMVGAVALGLGVTSYFRQHVYIAAYLLAYACFRLADLLVREDYGPNPARDALGPRIAIELPLLFL